MLAMLPWASLGNPMRKSKRDCPGAGWKVGSGQGKSLNAVATEMASALWRGTTQLRLVAAPTNRWGRKNIGPLWFARFKVTCGASVGSRDLAGVRPQTEDTVLVVGGDDRAVGEAASSAML